MRWMLAALVVVAVTACGSSKPAVSRDGRAVLQDAYDGHLDRHWSCTSLKAAFGRLPQDPPTYSTLPLLLAEAAGKACDAALTKVRDGDSQQAVVAALGQPDKRGRWWLYRWPAGRDTGDGARILFAAGRVSRIQVSVHG